MEVSDKKSREKKKCIEKELRERRRRKCDENDL